MPQASSPLSRLQSPHLPIIILLIVLLAVGLLTFRDYGLSWDEPLFYDYGKASQYAYSISGRLDGTFDLDRSFGASASDHVTRGPAYLLIGGLIEGLLEKEGLDQASAWHFTNLLTYLIGLIFFYLLARIWLTPLTATISVAFFATQPVLWNHAFINPKDSPFSTFFIITLYLGIKMIEKWGGEKKNILLSTILPGILLGITSAIRFLGPYAMLLIFLYFLSIQNKKSCWWGFIPYGIVAFATMAALWPYLWTNPIQQFIIVIKAMSTSTPSLKTLFAGAEYHAYELPRRYLPVLLTITLSEPTWPLFILGFITAILKSLQEKIDRVKLITIFLWFGFAFSALIGFNPPGWDGYRHYLFILPPIFLFAGFGINEITNRIRIRWVQYGLFALIFFPSITNIITLHPYQYAYYNTFVGGTQNAFRDYETDYWLTCYKEAMETFNEEVSQNVRIYVKREPYIASYYARSDISVLDYRRDFQSIRSGDYLLVNTRTNEDEKIFRDAPVIFEIGRQGAVFCVVKQIP